MQLDPDPALAHSAADGRYEFVRKLGQGGSGVVHLVRDRETGERLAWKQLQRTDERSIARLKREFRTLSNINHRNLVRLYDLGRTHESWFLTMEYLDGPTMLDYLDGKASISSTVRNARTAIAANAIDLPRIAGAFLQLATGVRALHGAGVLHRDLKPSNVIVEQGRVVVLDFGLALTLGDQAATITLDAAIAGTPAYMAPEQLQGRDWGEANDWYAFGVMLYEALSGRLPIDGRVQLLLHRKLEQDPVPIERYVAGLPEPLAQLCNALVQRQPERRPRGQAVITALESCLSPGSAARAPQQTRPPRSIEGLPSLFGRDAEQAQLRAAYAMAERGGSPVVHVSGASGAGKSALLETFLDELEQSEVLRDSQTLILRGRCYERETVAFKALDGVIDALVTQLSREEDLVVSHALPRDVAALLQLFPALERLPAVRQLLTSRARNLGRPQARDAAEAALRDLFTRLCSQRTLIVWVDDLHWGDPDSARILRSWAAEPGIPGLWLILSYRSEEIATSPCLRTLVEPQPEHTETQVLALEPLSARHVRALCLQRFAAAALPQPLVEEIVEHIVVEAEGSPFLASQLTVLALSELNDSALDSCDMLTVESLVARRTAQLSGPARRLLHVLSAAGRPLPARLALQLSAASNRTRATLHELSGLGLIRSGISDGERLLAVYHDRLREAVLASLSPSERATLERQLLRALDANGGADPAWLHALALGAGERDAALQHGVIAAERALDALAFERAAELYRACIALCPGHSPDALVLWQKLALALAHSGHGRQAAAAYREAAQRAHGRQRLQLERSAASHLLRCGAFAEGEALLENVLSELDLDTPVSTPALIAAIGWERARLALRGERFEPRPSADRTPDAHFEGYLCGTLSIELQPYDPLRAALFQARSLRMALDSGVPELLARALCVAATMAVVAGGDGGFERAQALLQRASELERAHPSALVHGNICSARAVCAFMQARLRETVELSSEAERMFQEASGSDEGEYYHRYSVIGVRVSALFELGQHALASTELQRAVLTARATENIAALLLLSSIRTRAEIAADQAQRALLRLEGERPQLPPLRFGLLNAYHVTSVMRVGCATGDHAWAFSRLERDYPQMEQSVFKRGGPFAFITPALHARLLLNHAVASGTSAAEAKRRIAADLRRLASARPATARGVLARTRARLALLAGDRPSAQAELERSGACFESYGVRDEAARDRYARAALIGGPESAAQQDAALAALRELGYVNPLNDLRGYYPELFAR